ncbi:hypothetical protein D3C76_1032040 [compost metagenome]|jgi:hypothetical protein
MSGLREERVLGAVLATHIAGLWTAEVIVGAGLVGDEIALLSGNARRLHRWQSQLPHSQRYTDALWEPALPAMGCRAAPGNVR